MIEDGTMSDVLNASFCEFRLSLPDSFFFSGHTVKPLLYFPLSDAPLQVLLSSEADLLSSDLNFGSEKRPLEKCPMLMLRTMRVFLAGLLRTCFSTAVLEEGVTSILSAGWLRVKEHLSSTGKSVVMIPLM